MKRKRIFIYTYNKIDLKIRLVNEEKRVRD